MGLFGRDKDLGKGSFDDYVYDLRPKNRRVTMTLAGSDPHQDELRAIVETGELTAETAISPRTIEQERVDAPIEVRLFTGRRVSGVVGSIPRGLESMTIQSEPLVALLPAAHPLAAAEQVALRDLVSEAFIVPNQTADVGFHRQTALACKAAGIEPTIQPNGRDFMTIASMVTVGLGVALVPRSMECMQLPGIVYRSLSSPATRSEISAVFRRNEAAPAANAFIAHCRREEIGHE